MVHGLSIYDWPVDELSFLEYINEKLLVSQVLVLKKFLIYLIMIRL